MAGDLVESRSDTWRVCRLDEVADIIDSLHKTPIYSETGRAMVRVTDVQGGFLDVSKTLRVTEEVFQEFTRRYAPKRGDIVFSRVGSYGNASYANTDVPFCLGQNTALLVPRINGRFLHLFLQSAEAREQIEQLVVGSTQKTISLKSISALQVPIPPAVELQAIADILGTLDDKIELNRRMNETLEAMARALFKSWFVDFEPVRAKAEGRDTGLPKHIADLFPDSFEDSELGEIPRGWRVGTLGDVAEHPRRGVQSNRLAPDAPYIGLEHMPRRSIALWEWDVADGLESNKFEFRKGEILFGKLRPYFHKVGVAPVDGVCSTDIVVVSPRTPQWFAFVLGILSSDEFVEHTNGSSTGTKMPRTSWTEMARYNIALAPDPVARAFTNLLQPVTDRINACIHESRTAVTVRDTLLPKLISGELRIRSERKFIEVSG